MMGRALDPNDMLNQIVTRMEAHLAPISATISLRACPVLTRGMVHSCGPKSEIHRQVLASLVDDPDGPSHHPAEPFAVFAGSQGPLLVSGSRARHVEKTDVFFLGLPIRYQRTAQGVFLVDRLFPDQVPLTEDFRLLRVLSGFVEQVLNLNYRAAQREERLVRTCKALKTGLYDSMESFFTVSSCPAMVEAQQLIKTVAPTNTNVVLIGEPGTGKELVARLIHELSGRAAGPLHRIHCQGNAAQELEEELFGTAADEASSAEHSRPGLLELADHGSLVLRELTGLLYTVQARLLRFIQDGEFDRVGSSESLQADVRIIAASTCHLHQAVEEGSLREDLFYDLNVFPVELPALRERPDDVPALLGFFCHQVRKRYGNRLTFGPKAMDALMAYPWPGNVGELKSLVAWCGRTRVNRVVEVEELTPLLSGSDRLSPKGDQNALNSLEEMEKRRIMAALERNNLVQSRAAKELGITLRQMGYRIKKFGLESFVKDKKSARHGHLRP